MDMSDCRNCTLFREKYKSARTTKKDNHILVILDKLPKNSDGSVNYGDLVFAINAREVLNAEKPLR